MNDFLIVFKTLYKNSHAKQTGVNGKKRLPATLTFVLSTLPLIIFACVGLVFLAMTVQNIETLRSLMGIVVLVSQMAVLFLSINAILNTLYSARDIALLNSLPLNQSAIFFAKMLIAYIDMLTLTSTIMLPGLFALAITFNVVNGFIFYGIYPLIIIVDLVAPLLPMFLIIIFSMPLNYLGSFFKGKSNLKSILSLLIYTILIGGYMAIVYLMQAKLPTGGIALTYQATNVLSTMTKVMYPNYVLLSYALGIEFGKNFGISIAFTIGMLIVILLLSKLFYRNINQKHLESHKVQSHNEDTSYKQQNIINSLIQRDLKLIFRDSSMTLSSLANLVLCPIMLVAMYFINSAKPDDQSATGLYLDMMNLGFLILYSMIFICGTNSLSMIAYTREGESFVITKTLPICAKDSIISKLLLSAIISSIFVVINAIIGILLYKTDVISIIVISLSIMIAFIGYSSLLIYYDMKNGNIHWKTNQDLRQVSGANKGTMLAVFSAIVPGIIMFILGFILASFESTLGVVVIKVIYCLIFFVISLIVAVIGIITLKKNGEQLYNTIGDKKFVAKNNKQNDNRMLRGM